VLYFFRFPTHRYLKLRFISNNFWTKFSKSSHSVLPAQLEGHDRVEGLLQGDGLQPELHVEEHGLSQPQKRPWTQKGSFPSSFGLFLGRKP
jgi:hypothetical protein